ncbi:MAG: phenylacetate--CoA ligase family protein [Candidatus Competibacteraceae bacterium]|nr:phenylacetate--CoA ligase family protein [Candidatus Competibacteraceae bacterium]MCP5124393.1 phenylacetate--CoA ligase family protein [Gammaproteobacteria bacterium]
MSEWLARNLFLPLHERLRGRSTLVCYRSLRRTEKLDRTGLRAHQDDKLLTLLRHCWKDVPFYRARFAALGIKDVSDISLDLFRRLPPVERLDVRESVEEMVARGFKGQLIRHTTGGSTGQPLVFYTDLEKESWHNAAKLRGRAWFGVAPGSRQVDFWGSPVELSKLDATRRFKDRWFLNHIVLSAFDLTDEGLARDAEVLRRFQPRLVYGYPTVLYHVALFMERRLELFGDWRPQLVTCTSEVMYPNQRYKMAEVFGCPIGDEYGSRDGGHLAHECPAGGLHIAAEHVLLEVDQPNEEGVGELLVTNLDGFGMPLLRYRVGDRVKLLNEPCPCGMTLPTLGQIAGRTSDFIVGRDGAPIHSAALRYVLRELSDLKQFKIIQRQDLSLDVLLVRDPPYPEKKLQEIRGKMHRTLRMEVPVRFSFPENIPPGKSGKYVTLVSEAQQLCQ